MTYCWIKDAAIALYLPEGSPFGIGKDGTIYATCCPDGVDGTNYPPDWIAKQGEGWAASVGLFVLTVQGDSTQSPFYQVEYADTVVGGRPVRTYSRTPKPLDVCKAFLVEEVLALRWRKRVGGFVWNGTPIKTDETTLTSMTGAVVLLDHDPGMASVEWDMGGGHFVTLDRATMVALAVAAGQWVQSVYTASKTILGNVAALQTVEACAAFDVNAGWPT